MTTKAQAAMEFLMTYGWAILAVMIVIGALSSFGILDVNQFVPQQTKFLEPLANADYAGIDIAENSIEIAFQNSLGVPITLPLTGNLTPESGYDCTYNNMSGSYDGSPIVADTTQIPNGAKFLIKWDCAAAASTPKIGDRFKATLTFRFTNSDTGQTRSHTGTVDGKYS